MNDKIGGGDRDSSREMLWEHAFLWYGCCPLGSHIPICSLASLKNKRAKVGTYPHDSGLEH